MNVIFALWFLIWLVCGGICAWLAMSKNRPVGMWLLAGLCFGVIAVVFAAFASDQSPPRA